MPRRPPRPRARPEDFTPVATSVDGGVAIRLHWSLIPHAQWGLRALCGTEAKVRAATEADLRATSCKQCIKSRQRQLDGRPH